MGPLGIHQAVEDVRCPLGGFFQGRAHRFEYLLQAGEIPRGGQDLGGVGALPPAFGDHADLRHPCQRQGEQLVRAVVLAQAITEVRQHSVVESRVVQVQSECVLEVDAAPHGLGRLPVGEIEQKLQNPDRGQLGW